MLENFIQKNIILFAIIFVISFVISFCKVEKSEKSTDTCGIILFQIGTVKIHKSDDNQVVDAKIKDIVKENDIIKTGSNSLTNSGFSCAMFFVSSGSFKWSYNSIVGSCFLKYFVILYLEVLADIPFLK